MEHVAGLSRLFVGYTNWLGSSPRAMIVLVHGGCREVVEIMQSGGKIIRSICAVTRVEGEKQACTQVRADKRMRANKRMRADKRGTNTQHSGKLSERESEWFLHHAAHSLTHILQQQVRMHSKLGAAFVQIPRILVKTHVRPCHLFMHLV